MDLKGIVKQVTGKEPLDYQDYQSVWLSWYKGNVEKFHTYQEYNGNNNVTLKRKTLGMAKKSCEDWANLLLNEKTDVTIDGEENQNNLNDLLYDVEFWAKGNEGVEKTFALGMGAFVESWKDDGTPKIQFVNRSKVVPITIEDDKVVECAFVSINSNTVVIQFHLRDNDGYYLIRTLIGEKQNNDLCMHFGDIDRDYIVETKTRVPMFQIFKPNIANNINIDSPLGISIFANAIDEMEGVDLAYDGFCNEMRNGKLKTFVDKKLTKIVEGQQKPVFDNRDTFFYQIGNGNDDTKKPFEFYAPTLRVTDYFNGINNALNLFSAKVGFGANHYRFDQNGVSTATQVISENSEMFRVLKKHEIILNDVIIGVCRALMYICNTFGNGKYRFTDPENVHIEVKFDDSIIEDKESQKASDRQDVSNGIMSKAEYRSKWYNEDLETAQEKIDEIKSNEPSMTSFFSGE